jgi:hypothetical protein
MLFPPYLLFIYFKGGLGKLFTSKCIYAFVALPEYFSVTLSLLNLLEESLGRSKPATKLMQAH